MRFEIGEYQTLVFDCDGVILDSNRVKSEAFFTVCEPFGLELAQRFVSYHQHHGGVSRNEKFAHFLDNMLCVAPAEREQLLAQLLHDYASICSRELLRCALIPGVAAFLDAMPAGISAHVVTGGAQAEVRSVFRERNLSHHFQSILGSPTSKRSNMRALADAGAFHGKSLYFGDAELDMQLATEFGLDFVLVYGASEWQAWRQFCAHPRIADFSELDLRRPR
jgi:beta-phosphoglucomutase-like phosphatase (HAD superfamily)